MRRPNHEKLPIWKRALQLVRTVYDMTRQLPDDERPIMTAQFRRTVVTIPSKIAQANSRDDPDALPRCLRSLRETVDELDACLRVARYLGYTTAWQTWRTRRRLRAFDRLLVREAKRLTPRSPRDQHVDADTAHATADADSDDHASHLLSGSARSKSHLRPPVLRSLARKRPMARAA
jgi:four helix bundle protein